MRNRQKMLIWLPPTGRPSERTLPSSDPSPWERRDSSPSAARSVSRAPRTLPGRAVIARPSPGAWDGGAGRLPRPGRRTRRPWSPRGGGSASRRPARGGRQWPSRSARAQRRCARRRAWAARPPPIPPPPPTGGPIKNPGPARPHALDDRGADEDAVDRGVAEDGYGDLTLEALELPPEGVAPDGHVDEREYWLPPPGAVPGGRRPGGAGARGRGGGDGPGGAGGGAPSPPSTPIWRRTARCSTKSPCSASTPILIGRIPSSGGPVAGALPLPAADRQPLALGDGRDLDAAHRGAQALRDLGDDLRIVEVGGRLHDRIGHTGRVLALEDARADEDTLGPELHHERRVRRRGDAAGDEVDHRQAPFPGHPGDQLVGSPELLGRDE